MRDIVIQHSIIFQFSLRLFSFVLFFDIGSRADIKSTQN